MGWSTIILLLPAGILANSPEVARKLNVMLISVDDLNDWVGGLQRHSQARTPNID